MENTRIPSGSSRRRPTGNLRLRLSRRHCTSLFVVQTMRVHNRSRAESRREATRESEEDWVAAAALAANSIMLAITLIYISKLAYIPLPGVSRLLAHHDGPPSSPFSSASLISFLLRKQIFNAFPYPAQGSLSIWIV